MRDRGLGSGVVADAFEQVDGLLVSNKPPATIDFNDIGGTSDGKTDNATVFEKLESELVPGMHVLFGVGTYVTSRAFVVHQAGISLLGHGGRTGNTFIRATHQQTALRSTSRSFTMKGICIGSHASRLNGHGLHIEALDVPNASISQPTIEDVAIIDQPESGIVLAGQAPYASLRQVHSFRNGGHGLVIDDGTYTNRQNRDIDPGIIDLSLCQIIDNGGYGLMIGSEGQNLPPYRVVASNIELNNNEAIYQAYINAVSSKVEYSAFGNTAALTPGKGAYVKGDNLVIDTPRFVNLSGSLQIGENSRAITISRPRIYKGINTQNQAVAIDIPASAQDIVVDWPNSMRFNADIYVGTN